MTQQVIEGDCLEILKTLPDKSIDLILQDPPYNTTLKLPEYDEMLFVCRVLRAWERGVYRPKTPTWNLDFDPYAKEAITDHSLFGASYQNIIIA